MRIAVLHEGVSAEDLGDLGRELAQGGHELEASGLETPRAAALLAWADCVFVVGSGVAARHACDLAAQHRRPGAVLPTLDAADVYRYLLALKAHVERARRVPVGRRPGAW